MPRGGKPAETEAIDLGEEPEEISTLEEEDLGGAI